MVGGLWSEESYLSLKKKTLILLKETRVVTVGEEPTWGRGSHVSQKMDSECFTGIWKELWCDCSRK